MGGAAPDWVTGRTAARALTPAHRGAPGHTPVTWHRAPPPLTRRRRRAQRTAPRGGGPDTAAAAAAAADPLSVRRRRADPLSVRRKQTPRSLDMVCDPGDRYSSGGARVAAHELSLQAAGGELRLQRRENLVTGQQGGQLRCNVLLVLAVLFFDQQRCSLSSQMHSIFHK